MQRFTLRLDDDLYQQILAISNKEKRSLNAQIEFALEKYIELYNEQAKIKLNVVNDPNSVK